MGTRTGELRRQRPASVAGIEAELDADIRSGRGGDVFPLLDGAGSRFGQDRIASGDLNEIHSAARGDDDIQADDASDGRALEYGRILGWDLGDQLSGVRERVSLLGAQRGSHPSEREGQTEDEQAEPLSKSASFEKQAR